MSGLDLSNILWIASQYPRTIILYGLRVGKCLEFFCLDHFIYMEGNGGFIRLCLSYSL